MIEKKKKKEWRSFRFLLSSKLYFSEIAHPQMDDFSHRDAQQVIFSPREYQHTLRSKLIFNTRQHVKKVHRRCANLLVRSICKLERDERRVSTIQRTTMQNRRIKGRRRISNCDNISFHWEGEEKKNPSSRVYFLGLMFALLSQVRMFELMILVKSNVFVHLQWRLMVLTEKRRYGGERSYRPPTREPNYSQSVLETATLN